MCVDPGPSVLLAQLNLVYYTIIGQQFELYCHVTNDKDSPYIVTFVWLKDDMKTTGTTVDKEPNLHSGHYSCEYQRSNFVSTYIATLNIESTVCKFLITIHIIQYGNNCIVGIMKIWGFISKLSPKNLFHISFSTVCQA